MYDMLSVYKCKICHQKLVTIRSYCHHCKHYSFSLTADGYVETETIAYGNYYFIFLVPYGQAHVVEKSIGGKKILNKIDLETLTPELANAWFLKLKKYVIFQ